MSAVATRAGVISRSWRLTAAGVLVAAGATRAGAQPALVPLHIGTAPGESYANAFFAQDLGYFKRAGLDVTIDVFASGGTIHAAVTGGGLDIGASSTTAAANAFVRGLPTRMIAPAGVYTTESPTTLLSVNRDSPIRTARDLAGKTIGVTTLRDISQVSVMAWLDKSGGDAKASQYVEIGPSLMVAAVTSNRVDAAFIGEPWVSGAKETVRVIGSPYDAIAKRFLIIGWSATTEWLGRNADTARRFVAALRETDAFASKNLKDTFPILSKYTKVPVDVMPAMHHVAWVPRLEAALVQPVIDASAQYQTLPHGFAAADMFYPGLD